MSAASEAKADAAAVKTKVCLIVIDGWGIAPAGPGNAITQAKTPAMTGIATNGLSAVVEASGLAVGLPAGVMGNSEVGHLTIGAGRVQFQDLERINFSIEDGSFYKMPEIVEMLAAAKAGTGRLHMLGLVSDGGVHSHIDHLKCFLRAAKTEPGVSSFVHFFADGRDTPPTSAAKYLADLQGFMAEQQHGQVATVVGRYYAMDRDNRWDRVQIAYDALVDG